MRGDTNVVELVDQADWVGLPAIVVGQLDAGFRRGLHYEEHSSQLRRFLNHPNTSVVAIDQEVSLLFADIHAQLRVKSTVLPTIDLWIAAAVARTGALLVTYESHYQRVLRIGVIVI